jgi:biotin synthase-like enzyme
MPRSHVRLSAGRTEMSDETQALCFFVGCNSIFYGDTLLTADNPEENHDLVLFSRLGIEPEPVNLETVDHDAMDHESIDAENARREQRGETIN